MIVGVVDIGTNSMRLLVTDGTRELGRWVEVTGLGRGVDAAGSLSEEAMARTLDVLSAFGETMDEHGVGARLAIATSASRDASNRDLFFDRAESALGVRPTLVTGEQEGRYAYAGATTGFYLEDPVVVSDIGGGSTELVTVEDVRSIDIGTVRLADRFLPDRPPSAGQLAAARAHLSVAFSDVGPGPVSTHVGVAGTWTSLSAVAMGLSAYDRREVHGSTLTLSALRDLIGRLSELTLEQTRKIPSLDPKRAPVILPGSLIAISVMETLRVDVTIVSERDTLDGAAMEVLGIA